MSSNNTRGRKMKKIRQNTHTIFVFFPPLYFQPHEGVSKSPNMLRNTGVFKQFEDLGHQVRDFGNISKPSTISDRFNQVAEFNRQVNNLLLVILVKITNF